MSFLDYIKGFFRKPSFYPAYEEVEHQIDELMTMTGIRIKEGQYQGLVFSLPSPVKIDETKEGTPKISFHHQIEYLPPGINLEDDLINVIGDIIVDRIVKDYQRS